MGSSHPLRDYQVSAIREVYARIAEGKRAVCLVSVTGSGKTRMGAEIALRYINEGKRVLWLAHRNELIKQAAHRLQGEGIRYVGIVAPWAAPSPHAPCQVASLDTLAARESHRPPADLIIPDECHHLLAATYRNVYDSPEYADAVTVGLTATPERGDGKPIGDIFDSLVVASSYSELIAQGHILPCKVFQPPERLKKDLALDPVIAYQKYTPGQKCLCFTSSVATARSAAASFNAAGIQAESLEAGTPAGKRAEILKRYELGDLMVICNAYILTEGYDAPCTSSIIIARRCLHITPYLQMAGRELRPFPGQTYATLIDLTGASLKHGLPTEDREYSLEGRGIRRLTTEQIRTCPKCGMCVEPGVMECDNVEITTGKPCGFKWVPGVRTPPKFLSLELREVYAGSETPEPAKEQEWLRLLKGSSIAQAVHRFKEVFGHAPSPGLVAKVPEDARRAEYRRMRKQAKDRGYSDGWAAHAFKTALGAFPPWAWSREPLTD